MARPKKNPLQSLEEEAIEFTKKQVVPDKALTLRRYYAGQALSGLLAAGMIRPAEAVEEAFNYSDRMLKED